MSVLWAFVLSMSFSACLCAQQKLNIDPSRLCNWGLALSPDETYGFPADSETSALVADIIRAAGLKQNFTLRAISGGDAAATIQGSERLILFNQTFILELVKKTGSKWAAYSVLAHEIGHHIFKHGFKIDEMDESNSSSSSPI